MASEVFARLYGIDGSGNVVAAGLGGPYTLTETVDDGVFDIDAPEQISINSETAEYLGTNVNNDVAVASNTPGIAYSLYTNQVYSTTVPALIAVDRPVVCFAAGTQIATPNGDVRVEHLSIGDPVRTADGRDVLVRWVGRQTLLKRFARHRAQLVRVRSGALGNYDDLYVTGDHGMVVDGCIVNASALVNGDGIDWVPLSETPERQIVYHVETEVHDIILANGAASETYLDMPGRAAFDNFNAYLDLYGAEKPITANPLPRISTRRLARTKVA